MARRGQSNRTVQQTRYCRQRPSVLLWIAVFLIALAFGGCNSTLSVTVEDLMIPPKLSEEQTLLYEALIKAAGTDNLRLKYPLSNAARSAFLSHDVDGDGLDETFVFYSTQENPALVKLNILRKSGDEWLSVYELAGRESDVDQILFTGLTQDGTRHIVIGWHNSLSGQKTACVYEYQQNRLILRFESAYDALALTDLTGDGLDNLLLLRIRHSESGAVSLVGEGARGIEILSESELSGITAEYRQVLTGYVNNIQRALFIDSRLADGLTTTDVVAVQDGQLVNLLQERQISPPERVGDEFCANINWDRITEIPYEVQLPGYDKIEPGKYLVTYMMLGEEETVPVLTAFSDPGKRFLFAFPDAWIGNVTVQEETENSEWSFLVYGDGLFGVELMRIRVIKKESYKDIFDDAYALFLEKDGYEYYLSVPENRDHPLIISQAEAERRMTVR